jgi:acyl carrier protein
MMKHVLAKYIGDVWMGGDASGLTDELPLIELNIIDSVAMFDFVHFLQSEFRVSVPLSQITPQNFASITAIESLVRRLQAAEPVR